MKIYKDDISKAFAAKKDISKEEAKRDIELFFETVKEEITKEPISDEREVRVPPFGKFYLNHTPAKENVQVANRIVNIEEQYRINFKSFSHFKIK